MHTPRSSVVAPGRLLALLVLAAPLAAQGRPGSIYDPAQGPINMIADKTARRPGDLITVRIVENQDIKHEETSQLRKATTLDYRLLDAATVGDRDLLYVYDAGNRRIIAFQRADGAYVRQWMAPDGADPGILDDVRAMAVPSVTDGPPVAYLLTADRVLRLVLQ